MSAGILPALIFDGFQPASQAKACDPECRLKPALHSCLNTQIDFKISNLRLQIERAAVS